KMLIPMAMAMGLIVALMVSLRFLPSLAAVALGRTIPLRASWQITDRQSWTLLAAALALVLPALLISGLVDGILVSLATGDALPPDASIADKVGYLRISLLV